jgi:hypothetical protein
MPSTSIRIPILLMRFSPINFSRSGFCCLNVVHHDFLGGFGAQGFVAGLGAFIAATRGRGSVGLCCGIIFSIGVGGLSEGGTCRSGVYAEYGLDQQAFLPDQSVFYIDQAYGSGQNSHFAGCPIFLIAPGLI